MASKSAQGTAENPEELLDTLEQTLDRLKVLYEQYFLGIAKVAPSHIHSEVERKVRDLVQNNLRNTALRYRFATLQQKFGSYNSYWRRTLRQIENGTYVRNLSKIGRKAAQSGAEVPEEILQAMPKRMREQVMRDRANAIAAQQRRAKPAATNAPTTPINLELLQLGAKPAGAGADADADDEHMLDLGEVAFADEFEVAAPPIEPRTMTPPAPAPAQDTGDTVAMIAEPSELRRNLRSSRARNAPIRVDEADGDLDLDAFMKSVEQEIASQPVRAPVAPSRPSAMVPPSVLRARERVHPTTVAEAPPSKRARAETEPGLPPEMTVPPPIAAARPRDRSDTAQSGPPAMTVPPPIPPIQRASPRAPTAPGVPIAVPEVVPPVIPPLAGAPRPRIAPRAHPSTDVDPPPAQAPRAPIARPSQPARPAEPRTPPGMTDADVNALYAKYVKAKEMVGETAGPGAYGKLLKTINSQAPKIMQTYNAKGVEFQVVVKDNQVIIRAKPKP